MRYQVLLCIYLFIQLCAARDDSRLEWGFRFDCANTPTAGYFTEIDGPSNQNQWECERITSDNGRETTSCIPSQLVSKPIFLTRTLTTNEVH
jgi:hypothetical protein